MLFLRAFSGCLACLCLVAPIVSKAAAACRIEKTATVPIGWTGSMMTVPARINGAAVTLGLDTGARTLIAPETASRLRLPRDPWRRTRSVGTTAIVVANNVFVRDLEFAGGHYRDGSIAAIAAPAQTTSGGSSGRARPVLDGLLGADILSEYDIEFDFSKSVLSLYRVRGCPKVTPEWSGEFNSLPFKVSPQRKILIPAEADGVRLSALFDTGASESAITRQAASKFGLKSAGLNSEPSKAFVGVGNIAATLPTHQFESLSAAGLTLKKRRLGILKIGLTEADMLVGQDFMVPNRFWISYATRTLFVQKQAPGLARIAPLTPSHNVPPALNRKPALAPAPVIGSSGERGVCDPIWGKPAEFCKTQKALGQP